MKYKEYLESVLNNDNIIMLTDLPLNEEVDYDRMVKVKNNEDNETYIIKLGDLINFGFNKEYSLKSKYPDLEKYWGKNNKKIDEIYFEEDIVVNLVSNLDVFQKTPRYDTPYFADLDWLNGRVEYDFKNLNYFIESLNSIKMKIYDKELTDRYINLVEYFTEMKQVKIIEDNYFIKINDDDLKEYFKIEESNSNYSRASYLVTVYNVIFKCLGISLKVKIDFFKLEYSKKKYLRKEEVLKICYMFDNPQISYIIYATFLGMGDKGFKYLRELKIEDIDEENMIAHCDGIDIPVDEEFIVFAHECNDIDSYMEIKNTFDGKEPKRFKLNPSSKYILKPRMQSNNNYGLDTMASISVRFVLRYATDFVFGDNTMTKTYLHRSGILHTMHELEVKSGIQWNTYNLLSQNNDKLLFTFNTRDMLNLYNYNYKGTELN